MLWLVTALVVTASPFPLPTIAGKAPAVTAGQRVFRLPMRFERLRSFYEGQFSGAEKVQVKVTGVSGARVLTVLSKRLSDGWTKAVVQEGELESVVTITPVLRGDKLEVAGNGRPLVEFIISRSADIDKAVDAIGEKHVNDLQK